MSYFILFISAFGAATILPFYSEVVFVSLLSKSHPILLVWAVATVGNTLGSGVNWILGRYLLHFQSRRWFPFNTSSLHRTQSWFQRYGVWSLLLAWLPIGGDAITFVAGVMRVRLPIFFLLTAIGKGLRYALVALIYFGVVERIW